MFRIMPLYELCEYKNTNTRVGFGWVMIEEFNSKEEAEKIKATKENQNNFMVRVKIEPPQHTGGGIIVKNLPKGHNLNATQRRELWKSNDPKDFRKLM